MRVRQCEEQIENSLRCPARSFVCPCVHGLDRKEEKNICFRQSMLNQLHMIFYALIPSGHSAPCAVLRIAGSIFQSEKRTFLPNGSGRTVDMRKPPGAEEEHGTY